MLLDGCFEHGLELGGVTHEHPAAFAVGIGGREDLREEARHGLRIARLDLRVRGAEVLARSLRALVPVAVRFLDDVIDISGYPLPAQETEAKAKRRIGLGVTGLADALIMCEARYGSARAVELTDQWMRAMAIRRSIGSVSRSVTPCWVAMAW